MTNSVSIDIDSTNQLQALAIDLEIFLTTLTDIRCVDEISNENVITQIFDRFTVPLQHKRRALADNIMHEIKRAVLIKDIVLFVRRQAHEINSPFFGVQVKNNQLIKNFLDNSSIEVDK